MVLNNQENSVDWEHGETRLDEDCMLEHIGHRTRARRVNDMHPDDITDIDLPFEEMLCDRCVSVTRFQVLPRDVIR